MIATLVALALVAADPDPAAIVAGYRKNVDAFKTLRVQWKRERRHTDAWRDSLTKAAAALKAEADKLAEDDVIPVPQPTNTPPRPQPITPAAQLRAQEEAKRRQLADEGPTLATYALYVTDRKGFVLRVAPPNWLPGGQEDWRLPDVPIDGISLNAAYRGYYVLAYDGDPANGFRGNPGGWMSQSQQLGQPSYGPIGWSWITIKNPPHLLNHVPPLGVTRRSWGGAWHPFDEFFATPVERLVVVGRAEIDGHSTIIVEHRRAKEGLPADLTAAEIQKHAGRLGEVEVTRAFVDPERGYLPLRMEWEDVLTIEGQPVPRPPGARPLRALEEVEIKAISGGGFYPVRGVIRSYIVDPARPAAKPAPLADRLAGKAPAPVLVIGEEIAWHAVQVQAGAPAGTTFAMAFAPNTVHYDDRIGEYVQPGVSYNREPNIWVPLILSGLIVAGWTVFGVAWFGWSRLRRRRAALA